MFKKQRHKRGILLFIVLGMLFITLILMTIILNIIPTQSRITLHQIRRIQAYYAAMAGVNYAIDKLRRNDDPVCWSTAGSYTWSLCSSGCSNACDINDSAFPDFLQVAITVDNPNTGINNTRPINVRVVYTSP